MWYLYVLRCKDNSLYCGITTDIARRIRQHNGEIKGGAKYTNKKSKRPVKIVYLKTYPNRSLALKAEYQFKQLSKAKKEIEISQGNLLENHP